MLSVEDIHSYYGDSHVLEGVSLAVARGEVVAILGRNGMGKTTLVRGLIGFTPPRQGRVLFKGKKRWNLERVFALFPRLAARKAHPGDTLAGGEQQMLAIGRALMTNPDLLLMDEPTEGLAPLVVREVAKTLDELRREGLSILLVEQNVPFAAKVADRIHVLSRGRIVHSCSPAELLADDEVKSRYLGLGS